MHGITRREFVYAGAAFAAALGLVPRAAAVRGQARYVHTEIAPGPYTREELSQIAANVAGEFGLGNPVRLTALGIHGAAQNFPEEFVVTLEYPAGERLVLRARRGNNGAPRVTSRT